MIRKLLIGAGILVVLLGAAYFYFSYRGYQLSPKAEASVINGKFKVDIKYCAPSVRDRLVFGEEGEEALQPYGRYWRLGANEATEITFNQDVLFLDQEVKKGTYVMYAIPGKNYFDIGLNNETGRWGYAEVDHEKDVVNVKVPVTSSDHTEQFTIKLEKLYDNSAKIIFNWSDKQWEIPVISNQ